jgi:voltage-gated potassium channel
MGSVPRNFAERRNSPVVRERRGNDASGIRGLGRNQDTYDRFSAAVELPLMVITILWIPVQVIPLVRPVHGSVAETFAVIDHMVWALFVLDYLIKLYLAPSRWQFVRTHILEFLIIAVPFFGPPRIGRLARVARLGRVAIVQVEPSGGASR